MTKKTINIFFIILGIIITTISVQKLLFIPLLIGLAATMQGVWGFIENNKDKFRLQFILLRTYICVSAKTMRYRFTDQNKWSL